MLNANEVRARYASLNALQTDVVEPCVKSLFSAKTLALAFSGMFVTTGIVSAVEPNEAILTKQAKITKAEAEHIALSKVPRGRVKSVEIENENGHLVWSFDIAKPNTQDITEILLDAKSGEIISTQVETPSDQAKEAAADKKSK